VDEEMAGSLVVIQTSFEQLEVFLGDEVEAPALPIRIEGGETPDVEQPIDRVATCPDVEERLVVVTKQGDQPTVAAQVDEEVEHAPLSGPRSM
jgi:hypothetical protein